MRVCKLVGTGGQAKILIQAGEVKLNGQTETRRRKKLQAEDVVEFQGNSYRVAEYVHCPNGSSDDDAVHTQD